METMNLSHRTTTSIEAELRKLRRRSPYTSAYMARCRVLAAELAVRKQKERQREASVAVRDWLIS
jgi:hypothetical protein